jgi:hypothetical protein
MLWCECHCWWNGRRVSAYPASSSWALASQGVRTWAFSAESLCRLTSTAAAGAAGDAADYYDDEEDAKTGCETDYKGFVGGYPRGYFAANGGVETLTLNYC